MDRLPTEALKDAAAHAVSGAPSFQPGGKGRIVKIAGSAAPWLIIGGLLWAGLFIKPQPVGSTVNPPVIERRDFFYGIATPAKGVLWIAGSNGKIVRTEDAGANWHRQSAPTNAHLQDIAAWDARTAVAVGNKGVVLVTSDGGNAWTEVEAPKSQVANKLTRVLALPQGHAWAVGEMGALLHSADFGKTWQRKRDEEDVGWNDIAFAEGGNGWVVGEFGRVLHSTDGGASWTAAQTPVTSSLMGVAFRDARNGVAVGLEGVVLVTRDGGASWQPVKSGTREHLFSVIWDAKQGAWIATGNQGVWVRGTDDAAQWQSGRLDERDLSWHTKAVAVDGGIYLAGSNVGVWDGKSWQVVTSSGRPVVAEENLPDWGRRNQAQQSTAK